MRHKLFITIGCPGSGKSTWIRNNETLFGDNSFIVSRDSIRFSFLGTEDGYFKHEKEVYKYLINTVKTALSDCESVIIDATHINKASRQKLFKHLGEHLENVQVNALVFERDIETLLANNSNRTGREFVPEDVIQRFFNSYEKPTFDEGFDNILYVEYNRI